MKFVYLKGYAEAFTAREVAANLEAILTRQQLLTVVAARVAGFSRVAAGALLNGVDGHPDELARVVYLFERGRREVFATLVDEIVAAIGDRAVRAAWKNQKQAHSVAPLDVLMSINTKLVDLASKPVSVHKMERAERAFATLIESKRTGDNRVPFEGWSVISN